MTERPVSDAEVARMVEAARAFAGDLSDFGSRQNFIRLAFNWDRLALKIVALADKASEPGT